MEHIGRYLIERPLGEGGMGVVYLCRDPQLGRKVAVKVLKGGSERDRERFLREARTLAALEHPGIVKVHDVGEQDGSPFLVMDVVTGKDLHARMREAGRAMPVRQATAIMEQVARIVDHVHRQGILHRDLKPENVLLTDDGRPMLLDFGLCKAPKTHEGLTAPGSGLGSLGYLPPEQLDNALNADVRSDVFGLGATLYALLTGRPPYVGKTVRSIIMDTLNGNAPLPSQLRPGVDGSLDAICMRALKSQPEQRHASAAAFADDLQRSLAGLPPSEPEPAAEEIDLGDVLGQLMEDDLETTETITLPANLDGDALLQAGNFAGARAAYTAALRESPEDRSLRLKLALAHRKGGEPESALDIYSALLEDDPTDHRAYVARGAARTDVKDFAGAADDFERALDLLPEDHARAQRIRQALRSARGRLGDSVLRPGRRPG